MPPKTMNRRWGCVACGFRFEGFAEPAHAHPLRRMCSYPGCSAEHPAGLGCSEMHSLLTSRLRRGKSDSLAPGSPTSGLALFAERRRLGLSRGQVTAAVRCNQQMVYQLELSDGAVPPLWLPALQKLGIFADAQPAAGPPAPAAAAPPPPRPAAQPSIELFPGLHVSASGQGLSVRASWPVLANLAQLIGKALDKR